MGGRKLFLVVMVCLLAASCAERKPAGDPGQATESAPAEDVSDRLEELCTPVAEAHDELYEIEDRRDYVEASRALSEAKRDLAHALGDLDAPGVDEYALALEAYARTLQEQAEATTGGGAASQAEALDAVVATAKAEVRLEEAAEAAGLPDECPPPSSVDPDNGVFVAKANRACFDLYEDAGGEPFDTPKTPEEVALTLDLGRRLSAGIARAVRDATSPGVEGIPVKKIIRMNNERFQSIGDVAETFESGDYGDFRTAARKLAKVSRKAGREMLSVGLVYCAKASSIVPL